MYPHHQQTIKKLTAHFQDDPRFLAMIIGGSVAKGWAAENSDVDFMLVATDEEFARRAPTTDYLFFSRDFTDYEDGYVDGKIIDRKFIEDVADHGSEPARAAFVSTWIACSRSPDLDALIKRCPVYPEAERDAKMKAFYSQIVLGKWFISEAEKRRNRYLLTHAASELALFGGRLLLAYNRILFPYHKWFTHELERAPEKPVHFMELFEALLANPGTATAEPYCEMISAYRDWDVTFPEAVANFTQESEWNWRSHRAPLHDW